MKGSATSEFARAAGVQDLVKEQVPLEEMFSLTSHQLMDFHDIELDLPLDDHQRLRFWEVEEFFKCPVAGWCLDLDEQKEILKKEGFPTKGFSDLEIHEALVASLENKNSVSRRIDLFLNRKYQKAIDALSSLEPGEFIKRWEASVKKEGFDSLVWVAVTKADFPPEVRRSMFGDVHMETHVRAKQLDQVRQRVDQERKRNERLAEKAKEVSQLNKVLKRDNEGLRNQLAVTCRLSDVLKKQNQELEKELSERNKNSLIIGLQGENKQLRAEKDEALKQIATCQRELSRLENRNSKLLFRLKKQEQVGFQRFSETVNPVIQTTDSSFSDSTSSIDLSQKGILVVGGLPKMEALYRKLIETNNGIFLYHDGRMNKGVGSKDLVNQVRRADFVICCIDHSSHTSALIVKTLSKRYKKPFRMVINSSLNNINATLLAFRDTLTSFRMDKKAFMIPGDMKSL